MRWVAVLLLTVVSAAQAASTPEQSFADVFAAVLLGENPDGGTWDDAGSYLQAARQRAAPSQAAIQHLLQPAIDRYRLLIVPGFLSACAATPMLPASAYEQARLHLKADHKMDVALLQAPDDSCENNGKLIAKYLREHATGGKKFIVLGHSKGAADLELALQDPKAASVVAALVSVAGAVGGSPLADLDGGNLLGKLMLSAGCIGQLGPALQSLRGSQRQAFLTSHPNPPVPSYSLVAASGLSNTSKGLLAGWWLLGAGLSPEDGMLLAADGSLPGAKFLGTALADHVAVAHDFQQTAVAKLFNKGRFPRAALLEALVRYVTGDLEGE